MKNIQLLAIGLILACGGIARAESYIKPAVVTIVRVQGEARYSTDGKQWHPLIVGKILVAGAVLQTAINSSVDLVLSGTPVELPQAISVPEKISPAADSNVRGFVSYKPLAEQNVVRMGPAAMLAIDKLTEANTGADTVSDTELDLRAGKIFISVKKMSALSHYIIKLPNGVAGIRGSVDSFSSDGSVESVYGTVTFSFIGPDGQPHTVNINGGFSFDPQTGQVTRLSPQIFADLVDFAKATQTLYWQIVSFAWDGTTVYCSPTSGRRGNSHSWWPF